MTNEKIWDKTLNSDEKVEFEFSIGQRYLKVQLIIWGIVSVPLLLIFGLGIIVFSIALFNYFFYQKTANVYVLTNKRILIHKGWLSTNTTSVEYQKITDIHVREPFFDRVISHSGAIAINTAGSGSLEIVLKNIESPYNVKKRIDELKDKVKL